MALRDPVAVYNAANNVEAHLVRNALETNGVEAHVTEDVSQVGTWMFGLMPEIHKPQVWVERQDIERVKPILDEYEQRAAQLRRNGTGGELSSQERIEAVCEECGETNLFPPEQNGSVQQCRHCRGFLDVGAEEDAGEWSDFHNEQCGEA